jgi:aryl-alcohol dehydrogenase-like predicted oxidoreductase
MISRRSILQSATQLGLLSMAGPATAVAQSGLLQRSIPSTGERLPAIGLGTYRTFNVGDSAAERDPLIAVTQLFFDHGGVVVDSSPRYGPSEAVFGDVLAQIKRPARLFAATKVDADGRAEGIRQMEASPALMGVDRIDLMQVHNLRDWRTQLPILHERKAQGEFRYVGISASRQDLYEDFEAIMRGESLDFIQINYSLGERLAAERILPLAQELGLAVLINRPFVAGELFAALAGQALPAWAESIGCQSWAQLLLKFVLAHPAVTVVLQATADPAHLLDNLGAARGDLPDAGMQQALIRLLESA